MGSTIRQAVENLSNFCLSRGGKLMFNRMPRLKVGACLLVGAACMTSCSANSGGSAAASGDNTNSAASETASSTTNSSTANTSTTTTTPAAPSSANPVVGLSAGVGAADIPTTDHNVQDDLQPS